MRPDSRRPPDAPGAARPAWRQGANGPTYSPGSSTSESRPLSSRFGRPRRSHISLRCEYFATAATVRPGGGAGRAAPPLSPPPQAGASMRRYPDSVRSIGPNRTSPSPLPPSPSSRYRASDGGPPLRCLSAMSRAIAGVASEPSTNTTSWGATDASCTSMAAMTALAATGFASSWARLSTWTKWRGLGHRRSGGLAPPAAAARLAARPSTATAPIATMSVASMRSAQCEPSTPAAEGGDSGPGRSESRPSRGASDSRTEPRIDLVEEMSAARQPASRRDEPSISRTIACGRSANGAASPAPAS